MREDWTVVQPAIEGINAETKDKAEILRLQVTEQWKQAAFISYNMGAGKKGETFARYLDRCGLSDRAEYKPKKKRSVKEVWEWGTALLKKKGIIKDESV